MRPSLERIVLMTLQCVFRGERRSESAIAAARAIGVNRPAQLQEMHLIHMPVTRELATHRRHSLLVSAPKLDLEARFALNMRC
jgi:hypothetical protein